LFVYFEVPNGDFILREQICWEFIYQHCSYFTKKSLITLFSEFGFEARDVRERFGDQFLTIEAAIAADDPALKHSASDEPRTTALCEAIGPAFKARVAEWSNYIEQQRVNRRHVVVWGAGAKAVTFLNIIDPGGAVISHVVDVNPRKVGRFIAGSGQEIVEPSALRELRPDAIILMNPIYREEIGSVVRGMGVHSELLVA
jgi:hypothetical protein